MVFLQGHPEYDADTLAREYRRDMLRFLRGEAPAPPRLPGALFPAADRRGGGRFRRARRLGAERRTRPPPFPARRSRSIEAPWRAAGVRLFRNWLALIARRKAARSAPSFAVARWGG